MSIILTIRVSFLPTFTRLRVSKRFMTLREVKNVDGDLLVKLNRSIDNLTLELTFSRKFTTLLVLLTTMKYVSETLSGVLTNL